MMKIGFYGGTFNPIHNGHISAAKAAKEQLELDKVYLIPDQIPPHKVLPEGSPSAKERLEMVALSCWELGPWADVLDIELKREGPSYTSDTMKELSKMFPDDELWFMMGSDMFLSFHTWHEPETICQYANLAAFSRLKADEDSEFNKQKEFLETKFDATISIIDNKSVIEVSSTSVRKAISEGNAENMVPEVVHGYIQRKKLYGAQCDLTNLSIDELRPIALSYLKVKRMPHVLGTEQEAVRLAEKYGADVENAKVAALLHDCTKKLDLSEQLDLCKTYQLDIDELEEVTLKLLHCRTGAAVAKNVFHVNSEVEDAIRWHTTGKPDMTMLEKIIYLADYIEPSRNFPGVDKLREAVYRDLDEGLLLGLTMTITEMNGYGTPVHHCTNDAREYLLNKGVYYENT